MFHPFGGNKFTHNTWLIWSLLYKLSVISNLEFLTRQNHPNKKSWDYDNNTFRQAVSKNHPPFLWKLLKDVLLDSKGVNEEREDMGSRQDPTQRGKGWRRKGSPGSGQGHRQSTQSHQRLQKKGLPGDRRPEHLLELNIQWQGSSYTGQECRDPRADEYTGHQPCK